MNAIARFSPIVRRFAGLCCSQTAVPVFYAERYSPENSISLRSVDQKPRLFIWQRQPNGDMDGENEVITYKCILRFMPRF